MASNVAFAGSVPANYEQYLGPILFEPYALDIMQRLPKGSLNNVLEIACGTGRVTKHLLDAIGEKGKLVATDLNPDMIAIAKEKVADSRIEWQKADAQDLPFADNSFEAVICQYGVMFFPDKLKAFSETWRVLKPGGIFIFNAWDSLDANPGAQVIDNVLQEAFGEEAPNFLKEGPYSFYDQGQIRSLLKEASFKNIQLDLVKVSSNFTSITDLAKGFLQGSPLFAYLQEKEKEKREAVTEKIMEKMRSEFGEASGKVDLQAIVCKAEK